MPRRDKHLEIGITLALILVALLILTDEDQKRSLLELIGAALGVLVGALLPDILEPATTPRHRKTCHSVAVLAGNGALIVTPPAAMLKWRESLRRRAAQFRAQREALPPEHPGRTELWLYQVGCHVLSGISIGLPVGYVSHLMADSKTSPLPPI